MGERERASLYGKECAFSIQSWVFISTVPEGAGNINLVVPSPPLAAAAAAGAQSKLDYGGKGKLTVNKLLHQVRGGRRRGDGRHQVEEVSDDSGRLLPSLPPPQKIKHG